MAWYSIKRYTSSQELGAESLQINCSDIQQLGQLKSKSTRGKSSLQDRQINYYHNSQSGMILELFDQTIQNAQNLSRDSKGLPKSLSSVADFHAKIFPQLERGLASQGRDRDYGARWQGWLAKYYPNSCTWKTPLCLLLGVLEPFLGTFPKWGTMQGGVCWELTMPELGIEGSGFGYLPTPTTQETEHPDANLTDTGRRMSKHGNSHSLNLADTVKTWPTPCSSEAHAGNPDGKMQWMLTQAAKSGCGTRREYEEKKMFPTPSATLRGAHTGTEAGEVDLETNSRTSAKGVKFGATLETIVDQLEKKKYPTPNVSDANGANIPHDIGRGYLRAEVLDNYQKDKGQLNPDWVEWLMGWPIGWSSLDPLEKLEFPSWKTDPADSGEVPRVGVKIPNRSKRLKAIGNGQVPQVATIAFSILEGGLI
jgi:hypothetical protein